LKVATQKTEEEQEGCWIAISATEQANVEQKPKDTSGSATSKLCIGAGPVLLGA
jgi:hypothetical protein